MNNETPALEQTLTPEQIKAYLLAHPQFFLEQPQILEELDISYQQKGTISLIEKQRDRLREQVTQLQYEISQLVEHARRNEEIFSLLNALYLELIQCTNFTELSSVLSNYVKQQHVGMQVYLYQHQIESVGENTVNTLLAERLKIEPRYLGRLMPDQFAGIFDDTIRSVALLKLGTNETVGLLAFGHEDETYFAPTMDTIFLDSLAKLITFLLSTIE